MDIKLTIKHVEKRKEPVCVGYSIPVSVSQKNALNAIKSEKLMDLNNIIRDVLDQIIKTADSIRSNKVESK